MKMTCFEDCTQLLEKRVRSRLSNLSLSFAQPDMTFDDFSDAFCCFLRMDGDSSNARNHNSSLDVSYFRFSWTMVCDELVDTVGVR